MTTGTQAPSAEPQDALDGALGRPPAIPAPDLTRIDDLNSLYSLNDGPAQPAAGVRSRLIRFARGAVFRLLHRQEQFNAAVVDHLNRNAKIGLDAHFASKQ